MGVAGALAGVQPVGAVLAQPASTLRIGVLTDMSGPFRDITGPTTVACVRQAVQDFGATNRGLNVEVLVADHQNKPDVGIGLARQWFDRDNVDCIVDVPVSSVALAVAGVVKEKNKVMLNNSAGTPDLTGTQCNPNTIHWGYDTIMLARSSGSAMVRNGGNSWFFIVPNYVFGEQLQRDTSAVVNRAGGKVLGAIAYPFLQTTDFSSYLVQAQGSGAQVIALANSGDDAINSIKQAHEFGVIQGGSRLLVLLGSLTMAHSLATEVGQGLLLTESFYWDLNDRTRAFMERIKPKVAANWPGMLHAASYASVLHYLKAVGEIGISRAKASGAAAVERCKAMPTDDDAFGAARIALNGRAMLPAYLF